MSPLSSPDKDGELLLPLSPASAVLPVSTVTTRLTGDAFQSSSELDLEAAEDGERLRLLPLRSGAQH